MKYQQSQLENEFHESMLNIYRQAKSEANYDARRFIQMLHEHRGVETAKRLINEGRVPEGFIVLWEKRRLDLTFEAMIMRTEKYHPLFTEEELKKCAKRL